MKLPKGSPVCLSWSRASLRRGRKKRFLKALEEDLRAAQAKSGDTKFLKQRIEKLKNDPDLKDEN